METLTRAERFDIIRRANKAWSEGDEERADQISKELPLASYLAKFYLEEFGKDRLLQAGF